MYRNEDIQNQNRSNKIARSIDRNDGNDKPFLFDFLRFHRVSFAKNQKTCSTHWKHAVNIIGRRSANFFWSKMFHRSKNCRRSQERRTKFTLHMHRVNQRAIGIQAIKSLFHTDSGQITKIIRNETSWFRNGHQLDNYPVIRQRKSKSHSMWCTISIGWTEFGVDCVRKISPNAKRKPKNSQSKTVGIVRSVFSFSIHFLFIQSLFLSPIFPQLKIIVFFSSFKFTKLVFFQDSSWFDCFSHFQLWFFVH